MNSKILGYMTFFVEVARTKNFRLAAADLGVPASTLSRHISSLEKALGLRLLNRSTRKVELTEEGEVYFERCQEIIAQVQDVHESLGELARQPTGTLRVSLPVDLSIDYLAPAIISFSKMYPFISFFIDVSPRSVDLLSDPFDLAIRMAPPKSPSTLIVRSIGSISRFLYASPSYLESTSPIFHPRDLVNHTCLGIAAANHKSWTLEHGLEKYEIALSDKFTINSVGLCREFAKLGLGITALSPKGIENHFKHGEIVKVLPEWRLPRVSIFSITESRLQPARVKLFISHLVDFLSSSEDQN